jgi:integrase/recombinase XerC
VPPAWAQIIDDYMLSLAAAGQSATSLTLRRIQLLRMARDMGGSPTDVTGDMLVAWFGAQTGWKTERDATTGQRCAASGGGHIAPNGCPIISQTNCRRCANGAPRPAPDHAWQSALAATDARTTLMLRLAGEAGMRRGEVSQVHTRDVLESGGGAQLLIHGKGNKERVVPISGALAESIRAGAGGHTPGAPRDGWLFPNRTGGHLTAYHVGQLVVRVLPDGWTMHTLRHRFSSRAYRGTRNLRAVQTPLGHSSIATTERYCAVDDNEIRAAMMAASGD